MTKLPSRYFVDPETNLALNTPNQWSHSPYLGAVKDSTLKNYTTSIHIPQEIWTKVVFNNHQKWKNAPATLTQENVTSIKIYGFADPRQAAWFMQELLYSDNVDTEELIEDYLEMKYCNGNGDLWNDLLLSVPAFEGTPLDASDEKEYFKKFDATERKKIDVIRKNTAVYESNMRMKIKNELRRIKMPEALVDQFGIEYFLTEYGKVTLKDLKKLTFKREEI